MGTKNKNIMLEHAIGKTVNSILTEDDNILTIFFTDGTKSTIKAEPVIAGIGTKQTAYLVYA